MEFLYSSIFPKIKSYIKKNAGNEDDAFDIFQDSIIILCKQIKSEKYNREHELQGFIYSVCRNLWINKIKRDKKQIPIDDGHVLAYEANFIDNILTKERETGLKNITNLLGEKCMELLKHSIFYKTPTEEIIVEMGFASANAVKTQKYKCKQKLFKILEENPELQEVID